MTTEEKSLEEMELNLLVKLYGALAPFVSTPVETDAPGADPKDPLPE